MVTNSCFYIDVYFHNQDEIYLKLMIINVVAMTITIDAKNYEITQLDCGFV